MASDSVRVWPGLPHPLGATWDGAGTNFALFSAHAEKVELCLFDDDGQSETARVALPEFTHEIWHALPAGRARRAALRLPRAWALRARRGPSLQPQQAADRSLRQAAARHARMGRRAVRLHGRRSGARTSRSTSATARPSCPNARSIDPAFTWGGARPEQRPWHETTIYEMHVRGFTMRHPAVPEAARGTFGGLAASAGGRAICAISA